MHRLLFLAAASLAVAHSDLIPVRIALKQQNLEKAYDYVLAVSDPSSSTYGRHWSKEDVDNTFRPHENSASAVLDYLSELGITDAALTPNGYWITLSTTAYLADRLQRLPDGDHPATRGHVEYVDTASSSRRRALKRQLAAQKLVHEPAIAPAAPPGYAPPPYAPEDLSHCATNTTPVCIRALYGIPQPVTPLKAGEIGVFEAGGQAYAQQDLNLFFKSYAPKIPENTHPFLESVNNGSGPVSPAEASGEPELDFQTVYGLLGNSNVSFLSIDTGSPNSEGSLAQIIIAMLDAVDESFCSAEDKKMGNQCGTAQLPKVLSISASQPELLGAALPDQKRVCNEFMKLSLQGHTIVTSSGDYGVAANPLEGDELCVNNGCVPADYHNENADLALNGTIFLPQFPANCPYVLTVGATMVEKFAESQSSESVMNLPKTGLGSCDANVEFSSSGGFANYFTRPEYQSKAVSSYFARHDPAYKYYNASGKDISGNSSNIGQNDGIYARNGRGIPDVSAVGTHFMIYVNETLNSVDGTSASTPLWASIVALLNQEREAAGKSPVGFINPVLYQHTEAFHDIVKGNNPGCGTKGFSAVKGWDPATGLGTPKFEKLSEVFKALP